MEIRDDLNIISKMRPRHDDNNMIRFRDLLFEDVVFNFIQKPKMASRMSMIQKLLQPANDNSWTIRLGLSVCSCA